jgi:AraC-like DNA-binding protein
MQDTSQFLNSLKQHEKLAIRVSSNSFGQLPKEVADAFRKPHRKTHYFFLLVLKGQTRHSVDLQQIDVRDGELLFMLPYQIHHLPENKYESEFFKMSIDQTCLSMLPRQFPFLINPLNAPIIRFRKEELKRVQMIFEILSQLLQTGNAGTELILAHLNSLLTEFDSAYFGNAGKENGPHDKLSKYMQFKLIVEKELTEQPTIQAIADRLAINTNSLYHTVKQYSGLSPKEYITNRLILEAQRRLYYEESSVKELAYYLGFNDPEYFSRLFRKVTGKNIPVFISEIKNHV